MKFYSVLIVLVMFSALKANANQPIICDGQLGHHLIHVELWDEVAKIHDIWDGPYKTSDNYQAYNNPVDGKVEFLFPASTYLEGSLKFITTKTATLVYHGFLAPDRDGTMDMDCHEGL